MRWVFNLLGIGIYFLLRYINRSKPSVPISAKFWWKDNWAELLAILLFDITLMLLLILGGITIDLAKYIPSLPDGIAFVGDLGVCFMIGLVISHGFYELFKSKIKR